MNASRDTNASLPVLSSEELSTYFTPDLREQHIFQLVAAATTGMLAWDLALDTYNIYRMLFKNRPSIPNMVFASSLTAMLFFFRVWALFRDRTMIIGFFTFLWLCVVGGSMTICFADPPVAYVLLNSSLCLMPSTLPTFAGAGLIIQAIFDTLVFFATSLWLFPWYEVNSHMTWKEWITFFFCGNGLPRISKALLQSGQKYYLLSVVANIVTLVFYFSPSVPFPYHPIVSHILISLINSTACKIYCDIKFGQAQASNSAILLSDTVFLPPNGGSLGPQSRAAVPPEAINTNMQIKNHSTITDLAGTDLAGLEVIIGIEHRRNNFEDLERM